MTSKEQCLCHIRRTWVAATPEEQVRQQLLRWMMESLGYPRGHLAVEQSLKDLPHLANSPLNIPMRRADILCYAKASSSSLQPLLLVECKAIPITDAVIRQVVGYNQFVQAPYIVLANAQEVRTGRWNDTISQYEFLAGLPKYQTIA